MFNSIIYVYYDKKSQILVDSFIAANKEVAIRFATMRIGDAVRKQNVGLLTIWSDCELYELDLSKEKISKELVCDLSTVIPKNGDKNEKDKI